MQFSFRKPHSWHPQNFAKKNTILAQCDTICVFKNTPKHYKNEENSENNLDQFLTLDLDQFLTLETPNLGPILNSTAHMELLTGPSLAFYKVINWYKLVKKHCWSKSTIKIGVSAQI